MNYINIITVFEEFKQQNLLLQRFRSDTLDRINNFSNESELFPILYAVPISVTDFINHQVNYSYKIYNFNLYCLVKRVEVVDDEDLPEDFENIFDNQTNINLNHTEKILIDLISFIRNYNESDGIEIGMVSQLIPINNFGVDKLQGYRINININIDLDLCDPMLQLIPGGRR